LGTPPDSAEPKVSPVGSLSTINERPAGGNPRIHRPGTPPEG